MSPERLTEQLARLGGWLRRRRAGDEALYGLAALMAGLWLFGLTDLLLRLGRAGRVATWTLLLGGAGAALWWIRRTLAHRLTPQGVAVTVERTFPELDNRLINLLQFAGDPSRDAFKRAYVREGVPGWERLDLRRMANRRARRNGLIAVLAGAALLLLPAAFGGRAWATAVWRIVNPFSDVRPVSLTHILSVEPGSAAVRRGEPLTLRCTVRGFAGHAVRLDIRPADGEAATYALGTIAGSGEETFAHAVPRVTGDLKYRFRAGDAPSPAWYSVTARPPPALESALVTVRPPERLGVEPRVFDGLAGGITIPRGSVVTVDATGNVALRALSVRAAGGAAAALRPADTPARTWRGTLTVTDGAALRLEGESVHGEPLRAEIPYRLWTEPPPEDATAAGVRAPAAVPEPEERENRERAALQSLERVIALQRENIERTRRALSRLPEPEAEVWREAAAAQRGIRDLAGSLLNAPPGVLGNMAPTVRRLCADEMPQAAALLAGVPEAAEAARAASGSRALQLQEKILRLLTFTDVAAAQAGVERRVDALSALLDALVAGEQTVVRDAARAAETQTAPGAPLAARQDDLAADLTDFQKACRRDAETIRANDETFAVLLLETADAIEDRKIRNHMLLAAEKLDTGVPDAALPHARRALEDLETLRARFDTVQASAEAAKDEAMREALAEARAKLEKIRELHSKALEAMDSVREQRDAGSEAAEDLMEEEYRELLRNTREAMLEVPKDLHIFMELNVANELVEDVFSIFQEIEQQEGSDTVDAGAVNEQAYSKEGMENYLEAMEEAEGRLDDMEMWLGDKPDRDKITGEAFDREELPEDGIALGALGTEVEDLISDLLEESEELGEDAGDSAMNFNVPDWEAGWEVAEGETVTYSAKGKSGNERPDHKEQAGRSNVGRQGMASGETAAGSGTIQEGDENVEARRTQDPTQDGQVDAEGEADTRATGGGKLGTGKADDVGMGGGTRRMDATEAGSREGMEALMAKRADTVYARASLQNVRADSLKAAAHHLRQANDALAQGRIEQVREHRKQALAALRRAETELTAGTAGALGGQTAPVLDDVMAGGPEEAPPEYRERVAEYYKALHEAL
ncbi:MAG: hypothetical protein JW951_04955 [Lentisphaerae bacterium]|nr:hypothetical protein [Lentisphaerota bacterium]